MTDSRTWKMPKPATPDAITEWEGECLRELQRMTANTRNEQLVPHISRIELLGAYPDTEISVHYEGRSEPIERKKLVRLWGSRFSEEDEIATPYQVALWTHTELLEDSG